MQLTTRCSGISEHNQRQRTLTSRLTKSTRRMLVAGDVPVLAPAQPISGSLRLSLMQRAPSAVRDHAAASRSHQRQRTAPPGGLNNSGPRTSAEEAVEDGPCGLQSADVDPGRDPASEAQFCGSEPDTESGAEDGLDALAVLANAVESTPQSPPPKPQPDGQLTALPAAEPAKQQTAAKAEAVAGSALGAISALAAIGSATNAPSEVVGPDVEFTVRELEVLTKEVERYGSSGAWSIGML